MSWNIIELFTFFNEELAAATSVQAVQPPSQRAQTWNSLLVNNTSAVDISIRMDNEQEFLVGAFQTLEIDPNANILFRYMNVKNENSDSEIAARKIFIRAAAIDIVPTRVVTYGND